jgi:hypothetical protein
MVDLREKEQENIRLPEEFSVEMKHWKIRDRAVYILYWINKNKGTMDKDEMEKTLDILSEEGIINDNVFEEMVRLKKQSELTTAGIKQ